MCKAHNVGGPPNLRRWVGWGDKKAGKQGYIEESFELAPKTICGDTTANGHRKGVPNRPTLKLNPCTIH